MTGKKDLGIDNLLAQDGDRYFVDEKGKYEVIFKVVGVDVTPEMPHGLKYTLMLLNAKGDPVVCFDNAHAVKKGSGPGKKRTKQFDHKHVGNRITPCDFKNTLTLLEDFWAEVDKRL
jgi:hypothetical protein